VDRLCLAADMILSKSGLLLETKVYPAVMRSAKRLTYTLAFAALFEGKPEARAELGGLTDRLLPLLDLYRALLKARHKRGALEFDAAEAEFDIDDAGRIQRVYLYERNEAHKLIEECMILANDAVARALEQARVGTLYRVHGKPEDKKVNVLLETLNALGVAAELPEDLQPRDFRAITDRFPNDEQRPFLESLVVRSMQQAVYQPENIGHFGLALRHYAHFTSPIRRYADLVVHRALFPAPGQALTTGKLSEIADRISERERNSDDAERDSRDVKLFAHLREQIETGNFQRYPAFVTDLRNFGFFVDVTGLGMSGLVPLSTMEDDFYELDRRRCLLIGRRSRRIIKQGDKLEVRVAKVDTFKRQVDFMPVAESKPKTPPSRHRPERRSHSH
jgi:ribonuclease R